MRLLDIVTRVIFGLWSVGLMLLAGALMVYSGGRVISAYRQPGFDVGSTLLEAVGYTVIAVAVFDVGKYLLEEEAIRAREMRNAGEARRSMTKFMSTIAIAVFLESLVAVFEASKSDITTMIYPTVLIFAGVAIVIGLGVYQRLSASVEKDVAGTHGEEEEPTRRSTKSQP